MFLLVYCFIALWSQGQCVVSGLIIHFSRPRNIIIKVFLTLYKKELIFTNKYKKTEFPLTFAQIPQKDGWPHRLGIDTK